jgi:two-component system sensor histidine kinase KdpD
MPEVNPTAVDVAQKLSNFIALMRNNPSEIPIRYVGPDQGVMVLADAEQITQVFTNIVRNAMQAMEGRPNSDIIIILKGVSDTTCREKELNPQTDWIEISFSDNGPGIPDTEKPYVFAMFYSGSKKVTDSKRSLGLGLALCRSIIRAHGCEITLSDNEPHGCCFSFTLPMKEVAVHE